MSIAVKPHTVERTVPGFYDHWTREWVPEKSFTEPREGFAAETSDGLQSWGRTEAGAVEMIERMRRRREEAKDA